MFTHLAKLTAVMNHFICGLLSSVSQDLGG
jgi:hypothetical protein